MSNEQSFIWQSQKLADDCETIECAPYDAYKDFKRDPSGYYVLIRVNFDQYCVEVAICDKDHNITRIFRGRAPQDIYETILNYEKQNNCEWFKEKTHLAYLGKELKKAELALTLGNNDYFQE